MTFTVAVIGGGVAGSSAAWHLAARGVDVTLFEQFPPGHDWGSSHGSSRIFRLAYADDFYVRLAQRALPLWRRLEEQTSTELLTLTGAVDHGATVATAALASALTAAGSPSQRLSPDEVAERWPGLRIDASALYHPEAGRLHADRAVAALQQAARQRGADIRHGLQISRIALTGNGRVGVLTLHQESFVFDAAVVAVGGWAPGTLPSLVRGLPALRVTQEQPAHFAAADALDWPSFIHHPGAELGQEGGVYGLGSDDGVKIGFHAVGPLVPDPYDRDRSIDQVALGRLRDYAREWLPGVDADAATATTCLYTVTPDHDFIIDRQGPITVLAGFSGHGFKFGSVLGELAADLVDGKPGLSRFGLARFGGL